MSRENPAQLVKQIDQKLLQLSGLLKLTACAFESSFSAGDKELYGAFWLAEDMATELVESFEKLQRLTKSQ